MKLSSYILEQALRQFNLPESTIAQFHAAETLGSVEGKGFPKDLFAVSAPPVIRGLLNYAVLQMKRDWLFPYWVQQQLDPESPSFTPRAQNPILVNATHRNWTMLGSPKGFHEAIIDPRGLATPLPREWSLETWVLANGKTFFPSSAATASQELAADSPRLTTRFEWNGLLLELEHFVDTTNHNHDILFVKQRLINHSTEPVEATLFTAIRPFNPEGVAPIHTIEFRSNRFAFVNRSPGVVFAEIPAWTLCSNNADGDTARMLGSGRHSLATTCETGLANAVAAFPCSLKSGEEFSVHCSVALDTERRTRTRSVKPSWRVSFEERKQRQRERWQKELAHGGTFRFGDEHLQRAFDASRLALLQLHDGDFLSPGPFLYHHFWYRDAALMTRALDVLGFSQRARTIIEAFPDRLTAEGFFKGPDGEWDSNGAALWTIDQHYKLTRSSLWLKGMYPHCRSAARWIRRMLESSSNGLMPASLSAEHLGTVDQYFWDSFWSAAGLRSARAMAEHLRRTNDERDFTQALRSLNEAIDASLSRASERLEDQLIPATPTRGFDESAIGSICSVYPLALAGLLAPYRVKTVTRLTDHYVKDRGFYHPFIHSGYNPYLTLQLAHSWLMLGQGTKAWEVADTIFTNLKQPYSLPEAIHPRSLGGVMGDGHHGWAAAEIVLFLRDCLIREEGTTLRLFEAAERLIDPAAPLVLERVPTDFGSVSLRLVFESDRTAMLEFTPKYFADAVPERVEVCFPRRILRARATSPDHILEPVQPKKIVCSPGVRSLFIEFEN